MKTVSYESIKADQAWIAVTQLLQSRNKLLAEGVSFLEKHPKDYAMAGRLVIIQYHIRATVRQLMDEACAVPNASHQKQHVKRQWLLVHQLNFLLRQIDHELDNMGVNSPGFRSWLLARQGGFSCKAPSSLFLN
ncbi:hypothetical protein GCM10027347_13250 [Larkinella harenae]